MTDSGLARLFAAWALLVAIMFWTAPAVVRGMSPAAVMLPGERGCKPVTETFRTHPDALWELAVARSGAGGRRAQPIYTTAEHPFWVVQGGGAGASFTANSTPGTWVAASQLAPGDRLRLADDSLAQVTGIRRVGASNGALTTYNFTVADHHTYFVGREGVWAHNACSKKIEGFLKKVNNAGGAAPATRAEADTALKKMLQAHRDSKSDDKLNDNEFGHAIHRLMGNDFFEHLLKDIPEDDNDLDELDTWMQFLKDNDSGYKAMVSALKSGGDTRTQGGWAVHHSTEKWLWQRLGPEFEFMSELGYLDHVPQFAIPALEGRNDPNGQPYWKDYKEIHSVDPPFHNGKGLAAHLGEHRRAFDALRDQGLETDDDRKRLLQDYLATNKTHPFKQHGQMPEVTRRFLNAVTKKAAKLHPSKASVLMSWIQ